MKILLSWDRLFYVFCRIVLLGYNQGKIQLTLGTQGESTASHLVCPDHVIFICAIHVVSPLFLTLHKYLYLLKI